MSALVRIVLFGLYLTGCLAGWAEEAHFEAADVHGSAPSRKFNRIGPIIHDGRYEIRRATIVDLISLAYSHKESYQDQTGLPR